MTFASLFESHLCKVIRELMTENADQHDHLPGEPGSTKVPEGHVRLYHQTAEENLPKIKKHGILLAHAKGIEGPKGVWASEHGFYGKPGSKPTVEFHVPKHEWNGTGVIQRDIHPHEIIATHHPWHSHARYMLSHPDVHAAVKSGEHDGLADDPRYGPAIHYIKKHT